MTKGQKAMIVAIAVIAFVAGMLFDRLLTLP